MRDTLATALPPLSGVLLVMAWLEVMRDKRGDKWCRSEGIGAIRQKKLGMLPRANLGDLPVALFDAVEGDRNDAQYLLENACAVCRFIDCPLHGK